MFAPTLDWLYWTIGGAVALVAIVFAWRAVFRDRARGRFRCPTCWYELTAPESAAPMLPVTCSECGRVTKDLRRLRKTRRRWGRVVLALVMVGASCAIALYPGVHRNGWASLVPTWFIVDTMPVFGYPTALTRSLVARLQKRSIAQSPAATGWRADREFAELAYIAKRFAEGTAGARPMSDAWLDSYGAFLAREHMWAVAAHSQPANGSERQEVIDAFAPLANLQPRVWIRTRGTWPEGVDLWAETQYQTWLPSGWIGIERVPSGSTALYGVTIDPAPSAAQGELSVELRVRWGESHRLHQGRNEIVRVSTPYRIAGSINDVLTPVSDPALDGFVRSIVTQGHGRVQLRPSASGFSASDVGFGVIVEYMLEGELIARERRWWGPRRAAAGGGRHAAYGYEFLDVGRQDARARLYAVRKSGENWTIRIYSDPETALRVIDADKYWQGDVTVPLTIR